jgi:hypothetical protein
MQSFAEVAAQLRLLDRPEVFLQQARPQAKTYIATSQPIAPQYSGQGPTAEAKMLAIEDAGSVQGAESIRFTANDSFYVVDRRQELDDFDPFSSDSDQLDSEGEPRFPTFDFGAE